MEFLTNIALGTSVLFSPMNILILTGGLILGVFIGALPGLGSSQTCALMLPLTLGMSMEGALIFFTAIYSGSQFGGAIPSIVINVPGTSAAVATAMEGYPMTQQGKADFALGLSTGASSFGGMFAALAAIFVVKPLSQFALLFKSPEMLLVALVGIIIIASVSGNGRQLKKGLLAGFVGLLIGAMSADPVRGRARLDFGFFELYDSFPLIPPLVGIFALNSLLELVGTQQVAPDGMKDIGRFKAVMKGVWATFTHPFILIWSSVIGFFIGVVPGPGIDTAAWMAYSQAKAWCKKPEMFGKGHPAGIIAPEAANNGCTGGALLPTLTLGIPGGATTAIMLAAIILHGVQPGPNIMRDFKPIVYAVLLSCFFGSFLCFFIGMIFNRFSAKISIIPTFYLVPATLLICMVSAYAYRYAMFDVYLMLFFGVIGLIMRKTKVPHMPLVIGLVMGPIAEPNYIRALKISLGNYGTFFSSPISKLLWLVIFGTIFSTYIAPIIKKHIEIKKSMKGK